MLKNRHKYSDLCNTYLTTQQFEKAKACMLLLQACRPAGIEIGILSLFSDAGTGGANILLVSKPTRGG